MANEGRTKICDLAELHWAYSQEPDGWISARRFGERVCPGVSSDAVRRRFFLTIRAAEMLDWPLESRMAMTPDDGGGPGCGERQVRPRSTALVLDAHLAAHKAKTLRPGFGVALAALATRYPWARYGGDPMDMAAIAAGTKAAAYPYGEEATDIVHEARLGRVTLRDADGQTLRVWTKIGEA